MQVTTRNGAFLFAKNGLLRVKFTESLVSIGYCSLDHPLAKSTSTIQQPTLSNWIDVAAQLLFPWHFFWPPHRSLTLERAWRNSAHESGASHLSGDPYLKVGPHLTTKPPDQGVGCNIPM
ncbi:MAG: hypothetical protein ACOYYS_27850 [Chloroflexota bacterium]